MGFLALAKFVLLKTEQQPSQSRLLCVKPVATDLFSRQGDLELQIRWSYRPLAALDH